MNRHLSQMTENHPRIHEDTAIRITPKRTQTFIFDTRKQPSVNIIKMLIGLASWFDLLFLLLGVVGAIGNGITMQLLEYETGNLINAITTNTSISTIREGINTICIRYVIVGIASFVSSFLMKGMLYYYGRTVGNKFKLDYFDMLLSQSQKWFDKSSISAYELSNLVVLQLESIQGGIGMSFGNVVFQLVTILTALILSFTLNWKFALVCCCILPIWIVIQIYVFEMVKRSTNEQKSLLDKVGGQLEELLYKIKTVLSFGNYDYEKQLFSQRLETSHEVGKARSLKTAISMAIIWMMIFVNACISFRYGGYLMSINEPSGDHLFNPGELYTIAILITLIGTSVSELVTNMRLLAEACGSAKMFFALKDYTNQNSLMKLEEIKAVNLNKPEISKGKISFSNVTFSYPQKAKHPVLFDFSLTIPAGKTTALIGESGCGKSTVLNLIERIYEPQEGKITIDDIPINSINLKHYRDNIGYVAQEPVLFNDTIRDNIIFGRDNVTDDEINAALLKANILKFVQGLENGLDYVVGIKGGKLSGGQKQRLAIARALLKNPKVLIFDEATSALDRKSERQVQKSINKIKGKMTMIVIAHRLNTIRNADNIVVLDKGGIILEQGTHEELTSKQGRYYRLLTQNSKIAPSKEAETSPELENDKEEHTGISQNTINDAEVLPPPNTINFNSTEQTPIAIAKAKVQPKTKAEIYAKQSNWGKLVRLISNFKLLFYSGCIFSIISGAILPISAMVFGSSINDLTIASTEEVEQVGTRYALYYIGFSAACFIIDFVRTYSFELLGEHIAVSFKQQILDTFLKLHPGYYDIKENTPGNLVSQMTIKTASINSVVLALFSIVVQSFGAIISSNAIGYVYDYRLTLINFVFIPALIVVNYFYSKLIAKDEQEKLNQSYGSILSETLCNTTTIFAFNAQEKVKGMYQKSVKSGEKDYVNYAAFHGIFYGFTMCIFFFAYALLFYVSGLFIEEGSLSFENLIKAVVALMNGTYTIANAMKFFGDISLMQQAINSIYDQIDTQSDIDPTLPNKLSIDKSTFKGHIEFRNVKFAYPTSKDKVILNDLSFSINQGEKIGFVGTSGAGKSTITELIERFYDVTDGEVLLDGVNIKEYDLPSLRSVMSFVQQEPVLFSKSVYENIKYGNLAATDEQIKTVANRCKIGFKLGMTIDNSKNDILSGGEKQRVAIARALLHSPKILLLDEATSALDNQTEKEIQEMLETIIEEEHMTVITIAHRLSTVEFCDKCYKIDKGKIVASGKITEITTTQE